ncbi:MAG: hypothetical protein CMJ64_17845 [Planctomycetaceae bacterium]|nr:hypothetical protein [Planctomycetaceae bacterium]
MEAFGKEVAVLTLLHDSSLRSCDGIARRDFLRAGTLAMGGLSLPWLLKNQALAGAKSDYVKDRSVVLLFLSGGASHIETFNPNMDAPAPYHSVTGEVMTTIPGVTFGGTFPLLSRHAKHMAIVRSFKHSISGHVQAIKHVLNGGTDPDGKGNRGFSMGAASARFRGANDAKTGMPTFTLLNSDEVDPQYRSEKGRVERGSHPGSMGPAFSPFNPGAGGVSQQNMTLKIARERLDDRRGLLSAVDRLQRQTEDSGLLDGTDKYRSQAFDLILGNAVKAFDLSKEPRKLVESYDTSMFRVGKKRFRDSVLGHHFLTARRLLEVGCRFVTIHSAGWDMHADGNNPGIGAGMEMLGRPVDKAVSAFVEDLQQRGMLDKTLLIITGDFGRTPKINDRGGRDHWPGLCTLAFAGGGMSGQVIGRSARKNDVPANDPIDAARLLATVMHSMFDVGKLRLAGGIPKELLRVIENDEPIHEFV